MTSKFVSRTVSGALWVNRPVKALLKNIYLKWALEKWIFLVELIGTINNLLFQLQPCRWRYHFYYFFFLNNLYAFSCYIHYCQTKTLKCMQNKSFTRFDLLISRKTCIRIIDISTYVRMYWIFFFVNKSGFLLLFYYTLMYCFKLIFQLLIYCLKLGNTFGWSIIKKAMRDIDPSRWVFRFWAKLI